MGSNRGKNRLAVVHTCPTCGGTGSVTTFPHKHDWRLVQSMGGANFNLQIYACQEDACEAALCSDCAAEGLEVCA